MPEGFEKLLSYVKHHNIKCDRDLLDRAYNLSKSAHSGQTRVSGEPYIIHPVEVACILAELELDCTSIVAGLLHDTIEDTEITFERLRQEFGNDVAMLVDGVTKLGQIQYSSKEEQQMENLRKMFLAMAKDIRVILIKLADRLHNMRTLKYKPPSKQLENARESIEIYAPLAHRLGISKIKWELEDISLRYIDPQGYYDLVDKISIKRREREAYINKIMNDLRKRTEDLEIKSHIEGRPKHFYSIYRKMREQNKTIDQIFDLFAVRIIVDSVKDCYAVLGMVHELYKPIPGRFKDYIAMPKPNMYQSLHTTLIGDKGISFEVQIRTWEMHRVAETGIAAHWKYKEGKEVKDTRESREGKEGRSFASDNKESGMDNKLAWLRQILEWQKDMRDESQFLENLKVDLFTDEVFVFTPKGDVINLPVGATSIDFAYAIHSAVGNKMVGAKINGEIKPLEYQLKNGDIIEILTSGASHGPSRDWLKIAKSSQAKNKINQWFKKEKREENILRGKEILEREIKKTGLAFTQLMKHEWLEPILKKYTFPSVEDMYAAIGYGAVTAGKVISRLKEDYRKNLKPEDLTSSELEQTAKKAEQKIKCRPDSGIIVKGIENCLVRLSKCCNPVPGDEIVGYITRGRGVSVHRKDCVNVKIASDDKERMIEVEWYTACNTSYLADITLMANDRPSLLLEVTNTITEAKIQVTRINARTTREHIAVMNLTLSITDTEQLDKIIKKLKKINSMLEVARTRQ